jgi:CBS domain containing-hemolysin-like protein
VAYLFSELMRLSEFDAQLYTITLVAPLVFVFGEVVPKILFQRAADRLMLRTIWILSPVSSVLRRTGAIWLLAKFVGGVNRLFRARASSGRALVAPKRRVAALLQEALAGEKHGEWQSDVIDRVVQLSETALREVMIPLRAVTSISESADRSDLIRLARETGYARLPVVGPRRNQVIGMVKIDTLLRDFNWKTVAESVEPVLTLSPTETVLEAITRLRNQRREAAIVTDRGGRMVGMITLRDLLQEIVGEAGTPG